MGTYDPDVAHLLGDLSLRVYFEVRLFSVAPPAALRPTYMICEENGHRRCWALCAREQFTEQYCLTASRESKEAETWHSVQKDPALGDTADEPGDLSFPAKHLCVFPCPPILCLGQGSSPVS